MTGEEFKKLRERYGLMKKQVAFMLKVSNRTVHTFEKYRPTAAAAEHFKKSIKLYQLTGKWDVELEKY